MGGVALEVCYEFVSFHDLYIAFEAHHEAPYPVEAADRTVPNPVFFLLVFHIVRRQFQGFLHDTHIFLQQPILGGEVFFGQREFFYQQVFGQRVETQHHVVFLVSVEAEDIHRQAVVGQLIGPVVRCLFHVSHPQDDEALRQDCEWMFGPDYLVCPVTEGEVSSWTVYLPENGPGWEDIRTGAVLDGGQYAVVPVDLDAIPVFRRMR